MRAFVCVYVFTVTPMMNPALGQALGPDRAPVPVPAAAVANQGAVTQEVAQTPAASQILTQRNPRRRWNHQTSQTSMVLR